MQEYAITPFPRYHERGLPFRDVDGVGLREERRAELGRHLYSPELRWSFQCWHVLLLFQIEDNKMARDRNRTHDNLRSMPRYRIKQQEERRALIGQ